MSNQNLRVPFEIPIPGGMSPGRLVILQGTIPPTSRSFAINLMTDAGDIALQICPKFHENKIVRNSVTHMMYGTEENSGSMPIYPGHRFEVLIECGVADFKIAFNNKHFADFNHRLPYSRVTNIGVEGDVEIHNLNFKEHDDEGSYGKTSNTSSNASYGFQPANKPSNQNISGGLYPTGSLYPTAPSPEPGYPSSGGIQPPYPPSSPSNYPSAPGPGLYPSPNPTNGSPYPSPYPNNPPSPRPSGPGFQYPGGVPSHPNGGYPNGPSLYPSVPNPGGYPTQGGGSPNRRSSSPHYPSQPGYDNDPYRGGYHGNQPGGYNPQPHNKPGFLDQAGAALAGVLGPALLSGGMNRRGGAATDGRSVLLDQAGRCLAGIFGGSGMSGTSRDQRGMDPHSSTPNGRTGILGQAGSTLADVLGGGGLLRNTLRRAFNPNHHNKHNKLGILGGALGTAAAGAALTGHLNPVKAAKKQLKAHKKALKYGIPIASAGLGAYVLHKSLKKGLKRSSSSSSCSSSD